MTTEIKTPAFPESISEGELTKWYKKEGEQVDRDELLADIETEKTTLEIPSPISGTIIKIAKQEGETVGGSELIAVVAEGTTVLDGDERVEHGKETEIDQGRGGQTIASPSARKLAQEKGIDLTKVTGTGRRGLITKEDVLTSTQQTRVEPKVPQAEKVPSQPPAFETPEEEGERIERRVPMSRLRTTIAKRLVEAQHNAAMLTTFNEVNMQPIIRMRKQYQEEFQKVHHGTKLGFMSFFVRASVEALKRFPLVNASIDSNDILYHGYYDIGVAVSTERGLVVPVVRNADTLGLAQIEDQIAKFGKQAREGKLAIEDMQGGTFTISNGGVFGSLLSTPILNPPQTAILGMHKIEERPIVEQGEIVIRPMMYLALSYDHRLIDGAEAVRFLVSIKGMLEDPARILLEL
ncbi:MAG: 2-oxoglutarate dehydrogenase complex dihydrolipoyllysine-residue succinyltransferase [Gammaproteobacteria bacterium]|nr:2-oxoglutarate dehydrogenase complex dihydrolipoyllysine-residue succinyltransferase [Gammaproteobacteria bacterium]